MAQITREAFQTAMASAVDALAAGNWASARLLYAQALGIKLGLDEKAVGDADSRLEREDLAKFTELEAAIKAAESVSTTNRRSFTRGIPL
ncbi:MAG: hypothetical protein KIS92_04440 [Planctomycetota bacterium]|nr:hypothetical protein [Planctomycetota bacterium]